MATYDIAPRTDLPGHSLLDYPNTSIFDCKRLCADTKECLAFTYDIHRDGCTLKSVGEYNSDGQHTIMNVSNSKDLYIRQGRPGYLDLWFVISLVFILVFIWLCRRSK
jgi:hypothetical protein